MPEHSPNTWKRNPQADLKLFIIWMDQQVEWNKLSSIIRKYFTGNHYFFPLFQHTHTPIVEEKETEN
jgi:hypothetical protein